MRRRAARAPRCLDGFTLIELLFVILIIAVLAPVAIPNFTKSVFQSRRAEAMLGLHTIHDLETAYYSQSNEYTDSFELLGFDVEGGTGLLADGSVEGHFYTYTLATWELDGRANANYRATATGDIDPSDDFLDIVIIENGLTVVGN